jgi:RNA polymerase sigma-70 factor (TIGR02960 family)
MTTMTTAPADDASVVTMGSELLERALAGDELAFEALVRPHRRELHVHCYRMLGSMHDADDALQETLLAAWRGLAGFEVRASLRTWLYRIATNRCLNARRGAGRRPQLTTRRPPGNPPPPTRRSEVPWLEPYPDLLLDQLPDERHDPAADAERRESVSLAFVTALQTLSPRQRAVLVLREVLGFRAREVAEMLDLTEDAATSALKRARAALPAERSASPPTSSADEQLLVERLTRAFSAGDVDALVALLTDDVRLAMPPMPMEYGGRDAVGRFARDVMFHDGVRHTLVPTRANGQPAFAAYLRVPPGQVQPTAGLLVFTASAGRVAAITRFDPVVLGRFAMPQSIPADRGSPA